MRRKNEPRGSRLWRWSKTWYTAESQCHRPRPDIGYLPRSVSPLSTAFISARRSSFMLSSNGTWSEDLGSWSKSYTSQSVLLHSQSVRKMWVGGPLSPTQSFRLPKPSVQSPHSLLPHYQESQTSRLLTCRQPHHRRLSLYL